MERLALITGASSGIGKELARIHADRGGDLVLVARREDKLAELKKEIESEHGSEVTTIIKDLSKSGSARELYGEVKNAKLQVDYLINNAGFGLRGKFHELPLSRQQEMMHLNMVSPTELMYLFLSDMTARKSGRILNVSSTASFMPGPLQAVYFATKSYVQFLSNAVAEELQGSGVTVTNLMPGATDTEFAKTAGMEKTRLFKKASSPEVVAKEGYEGMLAGELDVVSGVNTKDKIALSMVPFVPKRFLLKQVRHVQETRRK